MCGRKIREDEAVKMGIVEAAHDNEDEVRKASVRLGEELTKRNWKGEVYAEIRKGLYPEVCDILGLVRKAIATPSL
ncbi:hypothetical protein SLE2022_143460 [Rubroshorea leprosula]